nr:hypothetical protein [uncultured Selenomonas sp.]
MDEQLKALLGQDGMEVYHSVQKELAAGNEKVAAAAGVGAALFALHAVTWAERESRAAERKFTARDYYNSVIIDAKGEVQEGALNALRAGVDLDHMVPVVDISAALPQKKMSNKDVLNFIRGLVQQQNTVSSADGQAIFSILPKDVRHITYSSNKRANASERKVREASILSIDNLLENAVLIESMPNRKPAKKPNVRAYHRFYVPVQADGKTRTVRIVAEEQNGVVTLNPTDVNLYDVIIEKKTPRPLAGISPVIGTAGSLFEISIREMLAGVKDADGKTYYQIAWHGSGAIFDKFSMDAIGSAKNGAGDGYGIYLALNRELAEAYATKALYMVDVVSDCILRDALPFHEQHPFVQQSLLEIAANWSSVKCGEVSAEEILQRMTGKEIYGKLLSEIQVAHGEAEITDETHKLASEQLYEYGILGREVRNWNETVLVYYIEPDIIARYQETNGQVQGQFSVLKEGSRLINLFEEADESTFLHEMAHVLYDDMERLAPRDAETFKDFAAVEKWAKWHEGASDEYKGTPWEKEFAAREVAILAARKKGDVKEEHALIEEWKHERFARGFEVYIKEGKAPTGRLASIFEKGKRFLRAVYHGFTGAGGRASTEVEVVMSKLITTPEQRSLEHIAAQTPADRIFLKEKETLLAQHKKWNPTYTVRTAKKMAEQGMSTEDIADALQKHAPDIQKLPCAGIRQKAAEKIAASAANGRCAEQAQKKSAASR